MPELQNLYETILDKSLDRRNFQKKILSLNILVKLNEQQSGGAHRAAYLYCFKPSEYQRALQEGIKFAF